MGPPKQGATTGATMQTQAPVPGLTIDSACTAAAWQCQVLAVLNPCALNPQGPTISPVYAADGSNGAHVSAGFFAATICVPKKRLYPCVKELRKVRIPFLKGGRQSGGI